MSFRVVAEQFPERVEVKRGISLKIKFNLKVLPIKPGQYI